MLNKLAPTPFMPHGCEKSHHSNWKSGDWCMDVLVTPETVLQKEFLNRYEKSDYHSSTPTHRSWPNFALKRPIILQFLQHIRPSRNAPTPRHHRISHHRSGKPVKVSPVAYGWNTSWVSGFRYSLLKSPPEFRVSRLQFDNTKYIHN